MIDITLTKQVIGIRDAIAAADEIERCSSDLIMIDEVAWDGMLESGCEWEIWEDVLDEPEMQSVSCPVECRGKTDDLTGLGAWAEDHEWAVEEDT